MCVNWGTRDGVNILHTSELNSSLWLILQPIIDVDCDGLDDTNFLQDVWKSILPQQLTSKSWSSVR